MRTFRGSRGILKKSISFIISLTERDRRLRLGRRGARVNYFACDDTQLGPPGQKANARETGVGGATVARLLAGLGVCDSFFFTRRTYDVGTFSLLVAESF